MKEKKENLISPALMGGTTGLVILSTITGNPIPFAIAVPLSAVALTQHAIREAKRLEKKVKEVI